MVLKNIIENKEKFLTGVYLRVLDDLDYTLSPTYRVDSRVGIDILENNDYVLDLSILALDNIEMDRADVFTKMLRGSNVWVDSTEESASISGRLTLENPKIKHSTITISSEKIHQYTLNSVLTDLEGNSVNFEVVLTFLDKEYLHGLSVFNEKSLTPSNLKKLVPLISTNSFGELPILASYDGNYVRQNIKPYGYSDMLSVSENNILIVHGYDGRIGVDLTGSHTEVSITNSGYIMNIELKDKTHLFVYM